MCSWYLKRGPEDDVIISSRVRLARNLKKIPFPNRMNNEQAGQVVSLVKDAVLSGNQHQASEFKYIDISAINNTDKIALLEKHLISPDLVLNEEMVRGAIINKNEDISIMINEEDHIRIQSILPGMQLNQAWESSERVDNLIEESVDYAFSDNLGYLTSCPTNLGTGMRASVMVHLPVLNMIGYINGLLSTISKLGIAVRGLYGEGSEAAGNIYQISNQISLGQSEKDFLVNLNNVVLQITEQERKAKNKILKENKIKIEDKIFRSYGIFTNARLLSSIECLNLLSDIRLGIDLGLIDNISIPDTNELMVITQPASIQKFLGTSLGDMERDIKRAEIVRKKLVRKGN